MKHELFRLDSFDALEKHLSEHLDKPFTLTGADLSVLVFLTKCITLNDLRRDLRALEVAQEQVNALFQRIKDRENAKRPHHPQPPAN